MQRVFKIVIAIVITFLFLKKATSLKALDVYFKWEKTEIEVPLGSSITDYCDKYEVKLLVNGKESNSFYVLYEQNYTTFSTVITTVVGSYTIYYKAVSKEYYISDTVAIVFHVVDNKAPILKPLYQVYRLPFGQRINDFSWLNASDNYTKKEDLIYKLNDGMVSYEMLGKYQASVEVMDEFNNKTVYPFYIEIYDNVVPKVTVKKPLRFPYGEKINPAEYFLALDLCDGDLSNYITISGLDIFSLGEVSFNVMVSDLSHNIYEATFKGIVYDDVAPVITLYDKTIVFDIAKYAEINEPFFLSNIKEVNDNETLDLPIEIDYSKLQQAIGDYEVIYKTVDHSNNVGVAILKLRIRELTGPTIYYIGLKKYLLGTTIDPLALVNVTDNFDQNAKNTLEVIYNDYDSNKPGFYTISYRAYNSSGIFSEATYTIEVYELPKQEENAKKLFKKEYYFLILGGIMLILYIYFKKRKRV